MRALLITYHCVGEGPPPLCIDARRFGAHLDILAACGASTLTVSELADGVRRGRLPERAVALTFDDGLASVAEAAGMIAERGMRATVFCVAGRLGSDNGWATQPPRAPRLPLAKAQELRRMLGQGFEIGSHGMQHAPLSSCPDGELELEVRGSRAALERELGAPVRSFAYPYGAPPSRAAEALVRATYTSACTTRLAIVGAGTDGFALPRVDAHYLRSPVVLGRVLRGTLDSYLIARRAGAGVRRRLVGDHAPVGQAV